MSLRVAVCSEVKGWESWSLSESEPEEGVMSCMVQTRSQGDLVMGRLKQR